jgi:hypothetical protein
MTLYFYLPDTKLLCIIYVRKCCKFYLKYLHTTLSELLHFEALQTSAVNLILRIGCFSFSMYYFHNNSISLNFISWDISITRLERVTP